MKTKIFNFLSKTISACKFGHKNFNHFRSWKCSFYFDLWNISEDKRENQGYVRRFYSL